MTDFITPAKARAIREQFSADAITARLPPPADACGLCGQHPDKPCYMPPRRCPRPPAPPADDEGDPA
jgi:hypothetical protein